jgi:Rps23 Pro-64 3,4-dihydroxylase Tpa1-like proline 4-hydroxylase
MDRLVLDAARRGFQYRYETIRVPDDAAERQLSSSLLTRFAEFMGSAAVIAYLAELTGLTDIDFADAQATSYRPGDFLTGHHDAVEGKNRRAAYVLSLSPVWRTEWGGLLMFHGEDSAAGDYLVPQFNTLNLFAVPQMHSVSQVASFAAAPRRSITGWLRALQG